MRKECQERQSGSPTALEVGWFQSCTWFDLEAPLFSDTAAQSRVFGSKGLTMGIGTKKDCYPGLTVSWYSLQLYSCVWLMTQCPCHTNIEILWYHACCSLEVKHMAPLQPEQVPGLPRVPLLCAQIYMGPVCKSDIMPMTMAPVLSFPDIYKQDRCLTDQVSSWIEKRKFSR